MTFRYKFLDSGRESKCAPNPDYPNGLDLDLSDGANHKCCNNAPYPAPRCGSIVVTCNECGIVMAYTVAGRIDDVRTLTMPCRLATIQRRPLIV